MVVAIQLKNRLDYGSIFTFCFACSFLKKKEKVVEVWRAIGHCEAFVELFDAVAQATLNGHDMTVSLVIFVSLV